eukprot:12391743-Alexandrium_andersonii.AAC.1
MGPPAHFDRAPAWPARCSVPVNVGARCFRPWRPRAPRRSAARRRLCRPAPVVQQQMHSSAPTGSEQ